MAPARFLNFGLFGVAGFALGLELMLVGCAADEDNDGGSAGMNAASGGQSGAGGRNGTGGQNTAGSQAGSGQNTAGSSGRNASGGQAGTGGRNASGGQAGAGAENTTGGVGGTSGQTGGTSSGTAGGGAAGSGGAQNGGSAGAGASAGGAAGSGGTSSGECTRELLDGLTDDYFAALAAGDPSSLPLAADLKFTENAEEIEIGTTAFWENAGETKYSQRALDTTQCSVAAQAVIPENNLDLPIALRIKVEAGQMTEIETIVVRPGDYTASFAVDSNPAAIIAIAEDIGWHDEVPEAERATRQQLTSWIDKYFRAFPSGVCSTTGDCKRLENGGGNFNCGNSCSGSTPTTGGTFEPRVIIVDEVRGIAAGLTVFDYMTTGHLDMHMMKMSGGMVHAVHAMLRNTNGESGWD